MPLRILCYALKLNTISAGLSDQTKRDTINCVCKGACIISLGWSTRQAQESGICDWYSPDVTLFFSWLVSYLRCCSSTTTIRVSVSRSYSAMNCLLLLKKSMQLTLAKYFMKSLAPIRIHPFLMRRANHKPERSCRLLVHVYQ